MEHFHLLSTLRRARPLPFVHEAARKILPKGSLVLDRTVKHGLPTPVNLWMHGRHSFDRRYWNTIMTAECIKNLLGPDVPPETPNNEPRVLAQASSERSHDNDAKHSTAPSM